MTPQEFKAWFDGFTEAFDRLPTKAQWARVKERVAEIDGKPVTERMFVDRYLGPYPTIYQATWPCYYRNYGIMGSTGLAGGATITNMGQGQFSGAKALPAANIFNSSQAMTALGRAEAGNLQ